MRMNESGLHFLYPQAGADGSLTLSASDGITETVRTFVSTHKGPVIPSLALRVSERKTGEESA
jgi:hypothetical protein